LAGKEGPDLLKGGGGREEVGANDRFNFVTNPGKDTVTRGFGDDISRAEDGFRHTIDCGASSEDRVLGHDAGLHEIKNCEVVLPAKPDACGEG
jgi:hypothetical protein